MDPQAAALLEKSQHLVRNTAESHLERCSIADEVRDVASDLPRRLADRRMLVLDHRQVDLDQGVDAVEWDSTLRPGAWHVRIHLGDDPASRQRSRARDVHRHAQAADPIVVRRCDLNEGHIERQQAGAQQRRDGSQRHGYVVEPAGAGKVTHVAADVPGTVSEADRPVRRTGAIGEEVDQLDAVRPIRIGFERGEKDPWRRARGTDEDPCAGTDAGDGLLG